MDVDPATGPGTDLVLRLLQDQAPHLVGPTIRPSDASGSSNWVFRLGDDLAVRLPRSADYEDDLRHEVRFLPRLGPRLPVAVPEVAFAGEPSASFPHPWAVLTWLPGDQPGRLDVEQAGLARTLGRFVRALHRVDAADQPAGAGPWGYRCGEPVTDEIDGWAEVAAERLADLFDPTAVRAAWRRLRDVPPPTSPPCWVHTDLAAENLLVTADGALAGVIDFGGLGVGDGAVDLLYAWSLFDAPARALLREAAGADDATWARARAWAFVGPGLLTLAHYRQTMPERTRRLTVMVEAVAAEVGVRLR